MIHCKTKRWGNSLGLLIPKEETRRMHLHENQQVVVELIGVENPLKELFGFSKMNKITKSEFRETRTLLESSRF